MEYVYAAMLLHSAEKEIDDKTVTAVLTAAGVDADKARVKALVQSLSSVDIGDAMATAVAAPVAAAAPAASGGAAAPAAAEEHRLQRKKKTMAAVSAARRPLQLISVVDIIDPFQTGWFEITRPFGYRTDAVDRSPPLRSGKIPEVMMWHHLFTYLWNTPQCEIRFVSAQLMPFEHSA